MIDDYRVPGINIDYEKSKKLYKRLTSKEEEDKETKVEDLKVIVEINGVQYSADQVKSFLTFFENGVLRVSLALDETGAWPPPEKITDNQAPTADLTQPYVFEGTEYPIDDEMYKTLKNLSNLRGHPKKRGIKETKEIQSASYNVKDVTSFDNAVKDIVEKENELFTQNYRFYTEIVKPTAIFESDESGKFILTEKIVVIKADTKKEDKK